MEKREVVEIGAVGQGILGDDNVPFAVVGFVEERRYPAAGVGAADVDHPRAEGVEHGMSVIEQFLRRPVVRNVRGAVSLKDGRPNRTEIARRWFGFSTTQQGLKAGVDVFPVAGFNGIEETLDVLGHRNIRLARHGFGDTAPIAPKLTDLAVDDLGGGRGGPE